MTPRIRRWLGWAVLVALLSGAGWFGWRYVRRMGAAADVRQFTPPDARAVLWIPRLDALTETLVPFVRGVQEAAALRDLLKPETGVDLGDAEGLRGIGVDPEAGLVVFERSGMVHMLFGVEDDKTFLAALDAKFRNLGHPAVDELPRSGETPAIHRVRPVGGGERLHAAFAAKDGLLVLVYRAQGEDPVAGVKAVLGVSQPSFFDTERFTDIEGRLGKVGPLLYADGAAFARGPDGRARTAWLAGLGLPNEVFLFLNAQVESWLSKVAYAAARLQVGSCDGRLRGTVVVTDRVPLFPVGWLLSEHVVAPDFGRYLPRDTVVMTRLGLDLAPLKRELGKLSVLCSSFAEIQALPFCLGTTDPIAQGLGKLAHPDLADRHLFTDLVDHLTGHIVLAVVGVDRKAGVADLQGVADDPARWIQTVHLALGVQLRQPEAFFQKWWSKRGVLGKLGYAVEAVEDPRFRAVRLQRGCGTPSAPRPAGQKPPVCQHWGVILRDDVLFVTTGKGSVDRLFRVATGQTSDLRSLTREPEAVAVLDHGKMVAGGYFSFDGLLKAIQNRNLPGGASRYLAQFYGLTFTLDDADGTLSGTILLTR